MIPLVSVIIPVYEDMPSSACTRPSTTITNTTSTDYVKVNVNSSIIQMSFK